MIYLNNLLLKQLILNKDYQFAKVLVIIFLCLIIYQYTNVNQLLKYERYIKLCHQKKFINHFINIRQSIFLSICLPVYNMEKYIESSLLSLINQSFKNLEIIIVNDNSNDNTQNIIKLIQNKDKRIKLVNHFNNLGVFASRADGILNAKGKYILLMDPDDIILNRDIFKNIYSYNIKYNLDIIEFLVYHQIESNFTIIIPKDHLYNHFHNYQKKIITQPELSNILFYKPNSNIYSQIKCRTIWNKLIKKEIIDKSIDYLNNDYFRNQFLIAADDTPINILSFQFANNYSNINLPGYLYNVRKNGMSRNNKDNNRFILSYNYFLYFQFLLKYINKFGKDINFFLYDFKALSFYLFGLKGSNITEYIYKAISFFKRIKNRNISASFKIFINRLIIKFLK